MFETVMLYLFLKLFSIGIASSVATPAPPPTHEVDPLEGAEIDPTGKKPRGNNT